ncbi:11-beta-hydroxysteroid dehydrogenase-like 4A isoform X1 [Neltuma alba]|uniref:11-beta-hydroxysteroid dehydrogenase-like 4A isoform X1 n=1 Tax=Neltuma alba TaxID=207710 RepID=UPI0010A56F1C|nr:11-beta-hydroxysteroid dehydrogenase-like 4A isoform X1 [Prosopis alba]XP_028766262.1 11-beta-hydroxysteroid dehydrogenase-like 4A isoform X1 [Prosopis alba]
MDLIQKLLNITLIPSTFFALLLLVPPFYVLKFLSSLFKSCLNHESVAGKVALITGASSGIGEELAYEYARRGARLALVARREDRLRSVLDKALQLGSPDAMIIPADVSNIEDSQRFVAQTVNHFGQLDHLVNNAGIAQAKFFDEFSEKLSDLAPMMDINFWGSAYATHFAVPHLRKSRGKIVVISSAAAWCLPPRMSFYNASKAATISFFETLRAEFGPDIGITIVTPGFTKTEMTSDQLLEQMGVKTLPFAVPLESAERCAKAIVKSTCRGDMYLIEPSWTRTLMWLKWFLAAPVDWCFRFLLGKHRVIH